MVIFLPVTITRPWTGGSLAKSLILSHVQPLFGLCFFVFFLYNFKPFDPRSYPPHSKIHSLPLPFIKSSVCFKLFFQWHAGNLLDLSTIKERLQKNFYQSSEDCIADIRKMFADGKQCQDEDVVCNLIFPYLIWWHNLAELCRGRSWHQRRRFDGQDVLILAMTFFIHQDARRHDF